MKKLFVLLFCAAAFVSCNDDLKATDEFGSGPKIVGFAKSFQQVAYFADEGVVNVDIPVTLLGLGDGKLLQTPLTVNFEIDPASTAVEGQEYTLVGEKKFTIAANSTVGLFPIAVNTGTLNPTSKTELILKLTTPSVPGVVVGRQNQTYRIIFVGCQSQLAGTYSLVVTRGDGVTRTYNPEVITSTGINTFKTSNTGTFLPSQLTAATEFGFTFTDICGEINVPVQNLVGVYSNLVQGIAADDVDGTVTSPDSFTIVYEITFAAGNRTYTAVYTRLP